MALLAPIIGKEKTGELFFDRFLELCVNDRYDVRKLCATYCPHLCKVMGIEISEKYLVCNMCLTKEQYFIIVNHFINFIDLCSFFLLCVFQNCMSQIPAFLVLCEDSIWDVRKAAADSIRMIGLLCSDQYRRDHICPILCKLMNDSCRWVYRSAAESLVMFIPSLAKPCVLGVAYRPTGELYIPNAADADYRYVQYTHIYVYSIHIYRIGIGT